MSTTITITEKNKTFYFLHENLQIVFVDKKYLSTKGIEMIKKATPDDLKSSDFFYKLAQEQYGSFQHIYSVYNYIQQGGVRYSVYYDGYRRADLRQKLNRLAPKGFDNLTREEFLALVKKELPKPIKDVKITRLGYTAGFSYSPTLDDIFKKFPELKN